MNKLLASTVLATSLLITACGGGSDGDSGGDSGTGSLPTSSTISGKVIDGYISGATVFIDVNNNKLLDPTEVSAITDSNGDYKLNISANDAYCSTLSPIVVDVPVGAVDSDKGTVTSAYQLVLPPMFDGVRNSNVHITPLTSDVFNKSGITASCNDYLDDIYLEDKMKKAVIQAETDIALAFGIDKSDLYSDVTLDPALQAIADISVAAKQHEKSKASDILRKVKNDDDGQNYEDIFGVDAVVLVSVDVSYTPWVTGWVETITRKYSATNTKTVMVSLVDNDFEYIKDSFFGEKSLVEEKSIKNGDSKYTISKKYFHNFNSICETTVTFEHTSKDVAGLSLNTYKAINEYSHSAVNVYACTSYNPIEQDLDVMSVSIDYPSSTGHASSAVYSYDGSVASSVWTTELLNLADHNSIYVNKDVMILDSELLTEAVDALDYGINNSEINLERSIYKTEQVRVKDVHTSLYKTITKSNTNEISIIIERTINDMNTKKITNEYSDDDGVTWKPNT